MTAKNTRTTSRLVFYGGLTVTFGAILIGWFFGSKAGFSTLDGQLIAMGRLFGLIAAVAILLEVFLMSRIPFIEEGFDLHENIDLHRLTGYTILAAISAHIVFLVIGYAGVGHHGWWSQFIQLNTAYEDVFKATLGSIVFFGATAVSVKAAREKLPYEIWFLSHLTVYGAIILTFLHQIKTGGDFVHQRWFVAFWYGLYFLVFGLLVYYRGLRQLISYYKHNFKVLKVTQEAQGIYSVYITGKNVAGYSYKPGQYATWRFLSGNTWWESHPYSYSSIPGQEVVRFTFKTGGDFAQKLVNLKTGTPVLIDGPRGAFTSDRTDKQRVALIAGGIGVAPFMGSIDGLLNSGHQVILLYAARSQAQIAFKNEIEAYQKLGLIVRYYISNEGRRIDDSVLSQLATDEIAIYICGPDVMSKSLEKALVGQGMLRKQIMTERFAY